MQNLKKILALTMAASMSMSVMAGAAFTDQADVKNPEAVDMLTALNILKGYEDGSFGPEKTITRAEMAKMIYVARTGTDSADAYASTNTTVTDIGGHWAAGYIKYCFTNNIIAGKSATKFDPDAQVTGVEAAKMLLVTVGYSADKAGLVGANWNQKTLALSSEAGLMDGVTIDMSADLPRDYAAQLIYNTLDADRVIWSTDSGAFDYYLNGGARETVGQKYLGLWKTVGTLTSINKDSLGIDPNTTDMNESTAFKTVGSGNNVQAVPATDFTKLKTDYSDFLGMKVKVMYKDGKTNNVLGVYAMSDNNTYKTTLSKISVDGTKLKFDDKSYSLESDGVNTYLDGEENTSKTTGKTGWVAKDFDQPRDASEITFIDSDGNNKIDTAYIKSITAKKVTYVSDGSIVAGGTTYKYSDETIDEGLAKEDWVMITKDLFNDNKKLEKLEKVTGTLTATKIANTNNHEDEKYQVGDTWYRANGDADINTVKAGNEVEAVTINGVLYYIKKTSGTTYLPDVLMVYRQGSDNLTNDQYRVMMADGSTKIITIDTDNGIKNQAPKPGQLYYYEVNGSDYALYNLVTPKQDSSYTDWYDDYTARTNDSNFATYAGGTNNIVTSDYNHKIADDAKVIVYVDNVAGATYGTFSSGDDAKLLTGKQLKNMQKNPGANKPDYNKLDFTTASYMTNDGNTGVAEASIVTVAYRGNKSDFDDLTNYAHYGYVLSDAVKVSGNYIQYKMWTEDGEITIKDTGSIGNFKKGKIVGYSSVSGSGDTLSIEDAKVMALGTVRPAAVTGYSNGRVGVEYYTDRNPSTGVKEGTFSTTDATVLHVDSDKSEGVKDGSISESYKSNDIRRINAMIISSGSDDLDLLVVDQGGKMMLAGDYRTAKITSVPSGVTLTRENGDKVGSGDYVIPGETLTMTKSVGNDITYNIVGAVFDDSGLSNKNQITLSGYTSTDITVSNNGKEIVLSTGSSSGNTSGSTSTSGIVASLTASSVNNLVAGSTTETDTYVYNVEKANGQTPILSVTNSDGRVVTSMFTHTENPVSFGALGDNNARAYTVNMHNATAIAGTYTLKIATGDNSQSVNFTVGAAAANTVDVTGKTIADLDAPAIGGTPDTSVTALANTKLDSITWYNDTTKQNLAVGAKFEVGVPYAADIVLKANSGYAFMKSGADLSVTNASVATSAISKTSSASDTLTITVTYTALAKTDVTAINFTNSTLITAPTVAAHETLSAELDSRFFLPTPSAAAFTVSEITAWAEKTNGGAPAVQGTIDAGDILEMSFKLTLVNTDIDNYSIVASSMTGTMMTGATVTVVPDATGNFAVVTITTAAIS